LRENHACWRIEFARKLKLFVKTTVIPLNIHFSGIFCPFTSFFNIGTVYALKAETGVYGRHNPHKQKQTQSIGKL